MLPMTTADVQCWLQRYRIADREHEKICERYAVLEANIHSARTSSVDGMPRSSNFEGDRMGAAVARLDSLRQQASEMLEQNKQIYREIAYAIQQIKVRGLPGWVDRKSVLEMRYLDCEPWEIITEMMFGTLPEFEEKTDSYSRRTLRAHKKALDEMTEFLPSYIEELEVKDK